MREDGLEDKLASLSGGFCTCVSDATLSLHANFASGEAGMTVIAREDRRFGQDQSACDVLVKDCQEMLAYIEGELKHAGSH